MESMTKLRPYFVAQILLENTDEEHLITIAEILRILHDQYGIDSYRATVKEDIEMLTEAGLDVEFVKSSQNRYHIVSRDFDIAELKVLIDAVQSAGFISGERSQGLVEKISRLAGPFAAVSLKRNIDVQRRVKQGNGKLFLIVDAINDAINQKKQISFQYFRYNVNKERVPCFEGYRYRLSPYRLVWKDDTYYVLGYYEKYDRLASYRVDRMVSRPEILEEDAIPLPESVDLDAHLNSMFHMYSTERKHVELLFANDCMDALIDKFGEDVHTEVYDGDSFRAELNLAVNKIFYSWIFGFEGKARILGPEDVKEEYRQMLLETCKKLEASDGESGKL